MLDPQTEHQGVWSSQRLYLKELHETGMVKAAERTVLSKEGLTGSGRKVEVARRHDTASIPAKRDHLIQDSVISTRLYTCL